MNGLRAAWRLLRSVLHALHGVAVVLLRFPTLTIEGRREWIRWWAGTLLQRLGLALEVSGMLEPGAKLIVANHISWLDIVAVHAVCPEARFVSKADVQRWPLLNRLIASAETIYLERERKRDALRVVHHMAEVLAAGGTVAAFPEGTTGDGQTLLPFHANLLQAAISTSTPVQPLALRYADAHHAVSPAALWLGETTLLGSVWKLACAEGLVVHLHVLPPMATAHADRRALAATLREQIEEGLR